MAVAALCVVAAAVAADWLLAVSAGGAPTWLLATLPALGAVGAASTLLRGAPAEVAWDGRRFRLGASDGTLALCIDLGGWMLLRWSPAQTRWPWSARWLPVAAAAAGPSGWHALRCALHAPPPAEAPTDG